MPNQTALSLAAERCIKIDYSALPGDVRTRAKLALLDALVNCIRGRNFREITGPVRKAAAGTIGETGLIGTKDTAFAADAVFYNVVAGSITARNDHHTTADVHPGSVLLPALLAEAEAHHSSGKEFLEALIVGYEIMIRLGLILKSGTAYPPPAALRASMLPTPIGVAFSVAKLRKLDPETFAVCGALACHHLCGVEQWRLEGTGEDVYHNAWDTIHALHCVRLAQAGVRAAGLNFEGEYGFLSMFGAQHNADLLWKDLGQTFRITEVRSKISGACARVLAPMQLAEELLQDAAFQLPELEHLRIHINYKCTTKPWYTNPIITTQSEAINSVPYAVAAVLVQGAVESVSWTPPYSPAVLSLAKRLELVYSDDSRRELNPDGYRFEATMKDGRVLVRQKLTYDTLSAEKLQNLFLGSVSALYTPEQAAEILNTVWNFEQLKDVSDFMAMLKPE